MSGLFTPIDSSQTFWAVVLAAALWGLAGGFSHCIGMCGLFVLSCGPVAEASATVRLRRQILFQCGRMATLTSLGAAAGAAGSLLGLASRVAGFQGELSVVSGAIIALLALGYVGIFPRLRVPEPDIMGAGGGIGRRLFGAALRSRGALQPLALGLIVGLLPCGLTYTILIPAAASLTWSKGAAIVLAFGLGTIPGLVAFGMAGHAMRAVAQNERFRIGMTRAGAVVMLLTGMAMIWRGWPYLPMR